MPHRSARKASGIPPRRSPCGAFSPVPTAVPPMASLRSSVRLLSSIRQGAATISRQPETSCAKRMGVASCKWVRPMLDQLRIRLLQPLEGLLQPLRGRQHLLRNGQHGGNVQRRGDRCRCWTGSALAWSLGCSRDALIRRQMWLMTSLTFMLVWVPLPVCQTTRGNSSSHFPARISWQAGGDGVRPAPAVSLPQSSRLAWAQASFK